ncbi:SLIT and NTRK-like protein 2 [Periplaneta americana]|uniref:SLIT and NTRK-like protein 2 n=1 Tax=Periplaneta americana TaxID=6978 RepID=UPI0037E75963
MDIYLALIVMLTATTSTCSVVSRQVNGSATQWCPGTCSCVLLYRVDCKNKIVGDLNTAFFPRDSDRIRDLWLDYSNIKVLRWNAFSKLKNLRRLNLVGNDLVTLDPRVFSNLSKLKFLDLRTNSLQTPLHNNLFKSLAELKVLRLDYNKLTVVHLQLFEIIKNKIEKITLSNNPFVCNCEIRNVVQWFRSAGLDSEATCASPDPGVRWEQLPFTGPCIDMPIPNTMYPPEKGFDTNEKSSDSSFPLVTVLVAVVCVVLLLICGAISIFYWRKSKVQISNSGRKENESSIYDDVKPHGYYYYETVRPFHQRYISVTPSSRSGGVPELPKRPKAQSNRETKEYDDICNQLPMSVASNSYIEPDSEDVITGVQRLLRDRAHYKQATKSDEHLATTESSVEAQEHNQSGSQLGDYVTMSKSVASALDDSVQYRKSDISELSKRSAKDVA